MKNFFIKIGLFLGIIHQVKSEFLCTEYGCLTRKSVNCPEGMCTKHHLNWHRTVEFFLNNPQPFWIYHCQPREISEPINNVIQFSKPDLKLVD